MTGQYVHNHHARNNSLSGGCSSSGWQKGPERHSVSTYVKSLGFKTFFAGKYLNQYGRKEVGGPQHVPPGWDEWYGLVGNSRYYNYTQSVNGKPVEHGDSYGSDYFTDILVSNSLPCSYGRNFCNWVEKPENVRTSTGFEPRRSRVQILLKS